MSPALFSDNRQTTVRQVKLKKPFVEDVIAPVTKDIQPLEESQSIGGEQPTEPETGPDKDGGESLTSAMAIEGFVQGAPEDYTEARMKQIIESGDLEQLAEIGLNGEGASLLNPKSKEAEIQAFLNNVPSYMVSGRRKSIAICRNRRKFAIAKDDISPNGSTALHVAVLFGHTVGYIVRYLASRFPETMIITDNDGRTLLHYAATIKDNGHFYNMLSQLGGNSKALDKWAKVLGTPIFISPCLWDKEKAKDILNYTELLDLFGAEELKDQLSSAQRSSARRELQDGEISRTLERCYNVIAESGKLLSASTASALSHRKPLSASSLKLSVTSFLSRFLKRAVYEKIKRRQTRLDHNLFDMLWPAK
ncbi:uncharacterized protein LOC117191521 [Drosophila miranda]|uniref:uncharacterized protein LOC117191521 n=1 Tax=Drosophila miranda TaxID=7229 RepID=UPI00143F552B|nr:uncharacterized protein LOC117191521 [Drosophila miranda]